MDFKVTKARQVLYLIAASKGRPFSHERRVSLELMNLETYLTLNDEIGCFTGMQCAVIAVNTRIAI